MSTEAKAVRQGVVQATNNHALQGTIGFECFILAIAAGIYFTQLVGVIVFFGGLFFAFAMAKRRNTAAILSIILGAAWTCLPIMLGAGIAWIVGTFILTVGANFASLQSMNDYGSDTW